LRIRLSWSRKSSSPNWFLRSLRSSACASSSSNERSGLLDERQHVAHAEDALRHPVGMEALEVAELLARGREQDRLAGDRLDRQRGAAAGVAVELGQHDAVELRDVGELLGDVDGVLARHRVDHEQHDVGPRDLADRRARPSAPRRRAGGRTCRRSDVLAVALGLVERPRGDVDGSRSVPCS
jgi:hypothetical protein